MKTLKAAAAALGLCLAPSAFAEAVYIDDFSPGGQTIAPGVTATWTDSSTAQNPGGTNGVTTFRGVYANDSTDLTLSNLPAHSRVSLAFDLYIINSWDGSQDNGPDSYHLGIVNGPTLLDTTFSNTGNRQDFGPDGPNGDNPERAGAFYSDVLGYSFFGDAVYRLFYEVPNSDDSITFSFSASGLQGWPDEGWGVDNIVVFTAADAAAVPLPASWWAGAGLLGLLGALKLRRSRW